MSGQLKYLLDTDICIYIAKHNPPAVRERFARHGADELAMSVITYGELRHGAEKSQSREKSLTILERLIGSIQILPLPADAGTLYGKIRATLERSGQLIGNNDLWIAAHAKSAELILVSNNEREFSRVAGLTR